MDYIIDAGKSILCINIVKKSNPCKNLYCQKCVTNFFDKLDYDDGVMNYINGPNLSQDPEAIRIAK